MCNGGNNAVTTHRYLRLVRALNSAAGNVPSSTLPESVLQGREQAPVTDKSLFHDAMACDQQRCTALAHAWFQALPSLVLSVAHSLIGSPQLTTIPLPIRHTHRVVRLTMLDQTAGMDPLIPVAAGSDCTCLFHSSLLHITHVHVPHNSTAGQKTASSRNQVLSQRPWWHD